MTGKYGSPLKFHAVRAWRAALRLVISQYASWSPMESPRQGYSILIGCSARLAEMLGANLALLLRQDLTHLDQIHVAFDRPASQLPLPVERVMRARFPSLPLVFHYYSPAEAAVFRRIGLPYCYSWFSWAKGIAACRTQYALLHDFDAMLLRRDIIEERYHATKAAAAQYCGIRTYRGNGVEHADNLVTTFEMMFDCQFVRRTFRPIDPFNHVTTFRGKTVDFDTFLDCQARAGKSIVLPIADADMVHPSQVIHQFTEISHWPNYVPPEGNNLLFIPYFMLLAGNADSLRQTAAAMEGARGKSFAFFGRTMNARRLSAVHALWVRRQVEQLENATAGGVRPEVARYLDAIDAVVARAVS